MTQQRDCANSWAPLDFMILQTQDQSTPSPAGGSAEVDSSSWFVIGYFYRGEREILGLVDSSGAESATTRNQNRCAEGTEPYRWEGRRTDHKGKADKGKYALFPNR